MTTVEMNWLGSQPRTSGAVTSGICWPRGAMGREATLRCTAADGQPVPIQSWPLATWPDGSVKWHGVAAIMPAGAAGPYRLEAGTPAPPPAAVRAVQEEWGWLIDTGAIIVHTSGRGALVIRQIHRDGRLVSRGLRLVCRRQRRSASAGVETLVNQDYEGTVEAVTLEQGGPVRAVLKFTGRHRSVADGQFWLPFVLRLEFFAGSDQIRITHTFLFDGNNHVDFISGLGLEARYCLTSELHNRHVRFAGARGATWTEPVRPLPLAPGMGNVFPLDHVDERRAAQHRAEPVEAAEDLAALPVWEDFALEQHSPDHCAVQKRLGPRFSWVPAGHGSRAQGAVALSDAAGGLAFSVMNFWESFPAALTVGKAGSAEATITAWLWSPDAPAMDLRHYTDRHHRPFYESPLQDPNLFSSAVGIARTSELTLWVMPAGVSNASFQAFAEDGRRRPLLVASPGHYHGCGVFGVWSLPDVSTPARRWVETELTRQFEFYRDQVDQRRWYGFWNFGDVMHSYDEQRHIWRYDIGGYAWANTENAPDVWLWLNFLRTGRADAFALARAMTRHCSEVDVFHAGPFAALGSRHNVVHWGCGCKQPRVSQALAKRFFYYLTADERTGDLLDETLLAEQHIGDALHIGPGWDALASNWLTAWERRGEQRWRERLLAGLDGISALPRGLLDGPAVRYDPGTGAIRRHPSSPSSYMLMNVFGSFETWSDLLSLLPHEKFAEALAEYGRWYSATPAERTAGLAADVRENFTYPWPSARFTGWAARRRRDPELARRAWARLLTRDASIHQFIPTPPRHAMDRLRGEPVDEMQPATNCAAQWCLNAIELLALVPEALDASMGGHGLALQPRTA